MNEENIEKIKKYLELEDYQFSTFEAVEQAKEICVAKLCEVLGIKYSYNYKGIMFQIFSSVMAEAVCNKLKINLKIADDNLRLVKYNGINFVDKARSFLDNEHIDEATLDIFNFVDKNKKLLLD